MAKGLNKIPEPPEWLLIANHDALLTSLEIAKILGVTRVTLTNCVRYGSFPEPDSFLFEKSKQSKQNYGLYPGTIPKKWYWKVSTVRKFLKQQVQNQIDELKQQQQQQLQERAQ